MDNTLRSPTREPSFTLFSPEEKTALIELRTNDLAVPIEVVPPDWGTLIHTDNRSDSATPGPFQYESAPLRQAVQGADLIVIALFAEQATGGSEPQAPGTDKILGLLEMWDVLRRSGNVLLIRTHWKWLAPWEAHLAREVKPRTRVAILDFGGLRFLRFRATKRPRTGRRRR